MLGDTNGYAHRAAGNGSGTANPANFTITNFCTGRRRTHHKSALADLCIFQFNVG